MDEAEITRKYAFLESEDGALLFSSLIEALKRGAHIQYDGDNALFLYLEKYIENLTAYFERHEKITIVPAGSENGRYYFPLLNPAPKSNYSVDRSPLPKEHILIALLLYKAYYIDHNIELTSLKKFVVLVRVEMPDLKKHVQRLLVKTKGSGERFSQTNDDRIDAEIQRAFKNFHKLRWIELKEDDFTILPAFQRITREFPDYINHIDQWFKEE